MKKTYRLNKVIQILSENSRTSSKDIAKEISSTQQNTNYLINKLQEENIVTSFKLILDPAKFGLNNFCVLLRLKKYSKKTIKDIEIELKKYKEITTIDLLFGKYDLLVRFATPNPSYFNKLLKEILNTNDIIDHLILTQFVEYIFPRNYLSKKKYNSQEIISGDREIVEIDKLDKQIINYLNNDSKINYSHIAYKLKTTSKTIISRVKKLEQQKIIRGYSINFDYKKMNCNRHYILIKNTFENEEEEHELIKYIRSNDNIIEYTKTFGSWDSILTIETLDINNFKKTLYELKENFSKNIEDYNLLESEDLRLLKYSPDIEIEE